MPEQETEKDPSLENARRLYESLRSAGFTDESFKNLGEQGQLGTPFRGLLPDTIKALARAAMAFEPVAKGRQKSSHGRKQKQQEGAASKEAEGAGPDQAA